MSPTDILQKSVVVIPICEVGNLLCQNVCSWVELALAICKENNAAQTQEDELRCMLAS